MYNFEFLLSIEPEVGQENATQTIAFRPTCQGLEYVNLVSQVLRG